MNKKLVISTCTGCCYYSNRYYSYDNECIALTDKRSLSSSFGGYPLQLGDAHGPIPDECPLPDIDEKDTREVLGKEGVDG